MRKRARWRGHGHRLANEKRQVELRILKPVVFKRVRQNGNLWKHGADLVHTRDVIGVRVRQKNGLGFQTPVTQEIQQGLWRLARINHPTRRNTVLPCICGHFHHIRVGLAAAQFKGVKFDGARHAQPYTARREMQCEIVV